MTRTAYEIKLNDGTTVSLRLTLGGQINLKKRHKVENALAVFFTAMDDPEVCADLLTEALNYTGNTNTIQDGAELYDLLVDSGYADSDDFVPLLTSIACISGLLSEARKEALDKLANRLADTSELFNDEEETDAKN